MAEDTVRCARGKETNDGALDGAALDESAWAERRRRTERCSRGEAAGRWEAECLVWRWGGPSLDGDIDMAAASLRHHQSRGVCTWTSLEERRRRSSNGLHIDMTWPTESAPARQIT